MIDLIAFLEEVFGNPVLFFPLLFLFSVLVAVILPIPIEFALIWPILSGDFVLFVGATLTIAIGKTVGAWAIFFLGIRVLFLCCKLQISFSFFSHRLMPL